MAGKIPRILTYFLLCIVCLLANRGKSAAQNITGIILGTVRDPEGAVVPNAPVSAKNAGTGAERTVLRDASGGLSIESYHAGAYDVTVQAPSLRTDVRTAIPSRV